MSKIISLEEDDYSEYLIKSLLISPCHYFTRDIEVELVRRGGDDIDVCYRLRPESQTLEYVLEESRTFKSNVSYNDILDIDTIDLVCYEDHLYYELEIPIDYYEEIYVWGPEVEHFAITVN